LVVCWVAALLLAAVAPCSPQFDKVAAWENLGITTLEGSRTTLKETAQGSRLLLFVWNDTSPTCVAELCEFWSLWTALKRSSPETANEFRVAAVAAIWAEPDADRKKVEKALEIAKSRVWKIVNGERVTVERKGGEAVAIEGCAIDRTEMKCFLDREAVFTSTLFDQLGMGKGEKTLPLALCVAPDGGVGSEGKRANISVPLSEWFGRSTGINQDRTGLQKTSAESGAAEPRTQLPSTSVPEDCAGSQYGLHIAAVVRAKVMNLSADGKFDPQGNMSAGDWAAVLTRLGAPAERVETLKSAREPMTRARALVSVMRALLAGSETCELGGEPSAEAVSNPFAILRRLPLSCKDVEGLERLAKEQGGEDCVRRLRRVCFDKVEHLRGASRIPDWAVCYYAKALDMGLLDESPNLKPDEPLTREYGAFLACHFLRVPGACSGLLIDCSRCILDRAAAPSIEGEDGTVLYPFKPKGAGALDPARGFGTVGYYASIEDAKKLRGGQNPLIIPASDVVGTRGSMAGRVDSVIVSRRAKDQILAENDRSGFLQNWAVGFIIAPLEVKADYPQPNASEVSVSKPLKVSINKAVAADASAKSKYCQLLQTNPDGSQQECAIELSYDASKEILTIQPVERLKAGCSYSLLLKRGLLTFGATAGSEKPDHMLSGEFPLRFTTATQVRGEAVFRLSPAEQGKEIVLYDEAGKQERFRATVDADGTARLTVPAGVYLYRIGTTSSYVEVPQESAVEVDLRSTGKGR
jgi:hypothetical protein